MMNKVIILLSLVIALGSCEDSIKFEEPQPRNQNDLKRIPKQLHGLYQSRFDSTYLTINEVTIVNWTDNKFKTLRDSLDIEIDSTKIVRKYTDYIKVVESGFNLDLRFFGDSVMVHYVYRDTLFEISNRHILRRFKGHYFLNYKRGNANWKVRRLTLDKKELSFSKVRTPEDIESLNEITKVKEIKSDSSNKVIGYRLKPSRKELKSLMKHSFSETKTYRKLK